MLEMKKKIISCKNRLDGEKKIIIEQFISQQHILKFNIITQEK